LGDKKVILTLHDEWSYTGHCSYTRGCIRFKSGCGKCLFLETYPSVRWDNIRWEWKLKKEVFQKLNPIVICPSHWIASRAQKSFLGDSAIHVIPLGLDLKIFLPIDKKVSKPALGLREDDCVVGFGSFDLNDPRKGGDILIKALKELKPKDVNKIKLLLIGKWQLPSVGGSNRPRSFFNWLYSRRLFENTILLSL